jgi:hypothetical protein
MYFDLLSAKRKETTGTGSGSYLWYPVYILSIFFDGCEYFSGCAISFALPSDYVLSVRKGRVGLALKPYVIEISFKLNPEKFKRV